MQPDTGISLKKCLATLFVSVAALPPADWLIAPATAGVPALQWQPCGTSTPAGFECALVPVPLDHAYPDGKTITLAVIRHPATEPNNRIGTLFFNPGGPGGPGTVDMPTWLSLFPVTV